MDFLSRQEEKMKKVQDKGKSHINVRHNSVVMPRTRNSSMIDKEERNLTERMKESLLGESTKVIGEEATNDMEPFGMSKTELQSKMRHLGN